MLSVLSSLHISVLHVPEIVANKFYDRGRPLCGAALLTGCCTQHALCPFIDSEADRRVHFVGIPFINGGVGFCWLVWCL